ncbi:hypothetical protein SprV_0802617800 [Sparganum proliferum]
MEDHLLYRLRMHFQSHVSTTDVHEFLVADDCALNAASERDMQRSMDLFAVGRDNFGLIINTERTMVMHRPPPDAAYNHPDNTTRCTLSTSASQPAAIINTYRNPESQLPSAFIASPSADAGPLPTTTAQNPETPKTSAH